MGWSEIQIGDLGQIVTGKTPPTENKSFFDGPYQFVTPSDISFRNYYCRATAVSVTDEARNKFKNQFVPQNAVMFTCIGNTMGKCASSSETCLTNQQINSIVPFRDFDPKFVYYLMVHNVAKVRGIGIGGGSATPIVNKTLFSKITVKVPPKREQHQIAKLLSAYDDLIENNRRRIQVLEQSARLLYKEWFIRLRFPGYAHVKIKDGVPEGWTMVATPEIVEINPTERIQKRTEVWYVPMSSLSSADMTIDRSSFERRLEHTAVKFKNSDVLFARITPCLENGKTGFVNFLNEYEHACGSTEFIVLRGRKVSPYFTYCLARSYDFRENAIKSMIGSSGRQRVQTSCFNDFFLPLPGEVMLNQFDEAVSPCFSQIQILCRQNESLSKARDLLLPRLMNGEIEV
jgi:type I restriction enzyme S subunit